jgi:hypothetical protein
MGIMNVSELERFYLKSNPEGHYFDKDTLAFFGSRYRQVMTAKEGYIYSEKQTNAPEGVGPWAAMFFDLDGNPHPTSWGATRAEAIKGLENE